MDVFVTTSLVWHQKFTEDKYGLVCMFPRQEAIGGLSPTSSIIDPAVGATASDGAGAGGDGQRGSGFRSVSSTPRRRHRCRHFFNLGGAVAVAATALPDVAGGGGVAGAAAPWAGTVGGVGCWQLAATRGPGPSQRRLFLWWRRRWWRRWLMQRQTPLWVRRQGPMRQGPQRWYRRSGRSCRFHRHCRAIAALDVQCLSG